MASIINSTFFNRLESLSLHMDRNLRGFFGGKHLVKSYGQTIDFADYREYALGDDIRRIDWNLYARLDKYYIKMFTDERQMHVRIFLDCSASMGLDPAKGEYVIGVLAALGYLAVRNMDKLTLYFLKGERAEDPFGKIIGKDSFFRIAPEIERVRFEGETDFAPAITRCDPDSASDGLCILISDFMTDSDWKRAVKFLRAKKKQVLLLQVLTPDEADPAYMGRNHLIDVEAQDILDERNLRMRITRSMLLSYEEVMNEIYGEIRAFSISQGVDYVSVRTDVPVEKMLFYQLLSRGVLV